MKRALALCVLLSCAPAEDPRRFPDSFLIGTAIAGFQVDMGCPTLPAAQCEDPHSDWYDFITQLAGDPSLHLAGDPPSSGPGFRELYAQDFDRARDELHSNALRLSIEWSRLFPRATDGLDTFDELRRAADPDALAYYHALFTALKARGMTPVVTLVHYTLPSWLHDTVACHKDLSTCVRRGWLDRERIVREAARYAGFAAREFGADVDWWATLNEPFTAVVVAGYVLPGEQRSNPPGVLLHWPEAKTAMVAMIEAHNRMADAIHASAPGARVGLVYNLQAVSAKDPTNATDRLGASNLDYLMNRLFLNGAINGDLDANLDAQVVHREDLAGRTDWLGVNYYQRVTVRGLPASLFPADAPLLTFDPFTMVQEADASGLTEVLRLAATWQRPIVITETGLEDAADDGRAEAWIRETLARARQAQRERIPLAGYFYWSLMDNYEWNHGMAIRMGLYAVDKSDPLKVRHARARAVAAFAKIAAERAAGD